MTQPAAFTRRRCLALAAGAGTLLATRPAGAATAIEVVAELFSSQGCSACPPGDRLLGELSRRPGVLALSFHVDYWDYLGWRDTLAGPDFSQRQYDYAKARGDMQVFTPQLVVNGQAQLVASQRDTVLEALARARRRHWPVGVALREAGSEMVVEIGSGAAPDAAATLWLLPVRDQARVRVEKGEMAGRELSYANVVRRVVPAAMWRGEALRLSLPRDSLLTPDATGLVALLQEAKAGPILGCAAWGRLTS